MVLNCEVLSFVGNDLEWLNHLFVQINLAIPQVWHVPGCYAVTWLVQGADLLIYFELIFDLRPLWDGSGVCHDLRLILNFRRSYIFIIKRSLILKLHNFIDRVLFFRRYFRLVGSLVITRGRRIGLVFDGRYWSLRILTWAIPRWDPDLSVELLKWLRI